MIEHKDFHRVEEVTLRSSGQIIKFCNMFSCKKYGCQVN